MNNIVFGKGDALPSEFAFDTFFELYAEHGGGMWPEYQKMFAAVQDSHLDYYRDMGGLVDAEGVPTDFCDTVSVLGHRSPVSAGLMAVNLIYNDTQANWYVCNMQPERGYNFADGKELFWGFRNIIDTPPLKDLNYGRCFNVDGEDIAVRHTCNVADEVLLYGVLRRKGDIHIDDLIKIPDNPFNAFGIHSPNDITDTMGRLESLASKYDISLNDREASNEFTEWLKVENYNGVLSDRDNSLRFARQNGKPTDWDGIQIRDSLNSVKRFLKKMPSDDVLPKGPNPDTTTTKITIKSVEAFLLERGVVDAVNGRRVNLASPDDFAGKPPSIKQRAQHLLTRQTDKNDRTKRAPDVLRTPFVWAIPRTLENADLVAEGEYYRQPRIYYFKNYKTDKGQRTHLVITDKHGTILEHGDADGLITQYSPDLNLRFDDSFRVTYKSGKPEVGFPDKSPYPDYGDNVTVRSGTPSASTVALSNPAGVIPSTAQTRGVSRRDANNNNIGDFSQKVNTQNEKNKNFLGGGSDPAGISKKMFDKLLEPLRETGLAKDVITDAGEMRARLDREFGADAADRFMSVWHGSPHAFDAFSTAYIGTGEGNQVYGRGLYFTDLREIAEGYGNIRCRDRYFDALKAANPDLANDNLGHIMLGIVADKDIRSKDGLIIELRQELVRKSHDKEVHPAVVKSHNEMVRRAMAENFDIKFPPIENNLYNVKIHGDKTVEDLNFMRWDKKITEEHQTQIAEQLVKEGVEDTFLIYSDTKKFAARDIYDGYDVLKHLRRDLGSDKAASEFLLRAGIDGIQYPTGYKSKGSHEDSYNYVVFDDKALEIVEHIRLMSTPDGSEVYGFATKDGKIYLDPEKMNANTPIHEYTHLYMDVIKRQNVPLYDRLIESAKHSMTFEELSRNPHYSRLSDDERAEETVAFLAGRKGADMFFTDNTWAGKFRAALSDTYSWIKERVFGKSPPPLVRDLTPEEFSEMSLSDITAAMAKDMLNGRRIGDGVFTDNNQDIRFDREAGEMGQKSAYKVDMGKFFEKSAERIGSAAEYLAFRGFDVKQGGDGRLEGADAELFRRFGIGFDDKFKWGTGSKMWDAVIFPTGGDSFIARNTDKNADIENRHRKHGDIRIFNREALYTSDKPVFIVEGEMDALSIMAVGGNAVSLGSTANVEILVDMLRARPPSQPLLLALDNDKSGENATERLMDGLQEIGVRADDVRMLLYGKNKDANDVLRDNREIMALMVGECVNIMDGKSPAINQDVSQDVIDSQIKLILNYGSSVKDVNEFLDIYDYHKSNDAYYQMTLMLDKNSDVVFNNMENALKFTKLQDDLCDKFPGFAAEMDRVMGAKIDVNCKMKLDSCSLSCNDTALQVARHNPISKEDFAKKLDRVNRLKDILQNKGEYDYPIPVSYEKRTESKWKNYNDVSAALSGLYTDINGCMQKIKACGLRKLSTPDNEPVLSCLHKMIEKHNEWNTSKHITDIDKRVTRLGYIEKDLRAECDRRMSRPGFDIDDVNKAIEYIRDVHNFKVKPETARFAENMVNAGKATPVEICETIAGELRMGMRHEWQQVTFGKDNKVERADFVFSGNTGGMADGDFSVRRDAQTNTYIVNVIDRGKPVCLSDKLDLSVKSNFDSIRRLVEHNTWERRFIGAFNDLSKSKEVEISKPPREPQKTERFLGFVKKNVDFSFV